MTIEGLELFSLWVEALLSTISVLLFLFIGWQLAQTLRKKTQHKNMAQKNHTRLPRLVAIEPFKQLRFLKVKQFQQISRSLVRDTQEFLNRTETDSYEARAMIPLICEARKLGEKLLSERKKIHRFLNTKAEYQIELTIHELILVETRLRAIPRAAYTLEDVIAGRFEAA